MSYIPPAEYEEFINVIKARKSCEYDAYYDTYDCQCDSNEDEDFPVLRMLIGTEDSNRWFDYTSKFYAKKKSNGC